MIRSTAYSGHETGPRFLVLGAVHGNEKCGTVAINRIIKEIESGKLKITRGQITFVPIANQRAYDADKRFIERNLNRYLVPMSKPTSYEAELGNSLCPMLENCDFLLDIHSYTVGGAPFIIMASSDEKERSYAGSLGPYTLMSGWMEAYATTGRKTGSDDKDEGTGTTEYARRFGALAVTLECGQHRATEAPEVAYQAIRNGLRYLEMTDEPKLEAHAPAQYVTVTHVFYRDDMGDLTKPWKNLEAVKKDEVIARTTAGHNITSPSNGFVIMPKLDAPIGSEWFYIGVEKAV